jgi:hypothetical protein
MVNQKSGPSPGCARVVSSIGSEKRRLGGCWRAIDSRRKSTGGGWKRSGTR